MAVHDGTGVRVWLAALRLASASRILEWLASQQKFDILRLRPHISLNDSPFVLICGPQVS